jgi:hypothetical protein
MDAIDTALKREAARQASAPNAEPQTYTAAALRQLGLDSADQVRTQDEFLSLKLAQMKDQRVAEGQDSPFGIAADKPVDDRPRVEITPDMTSLDDYLNAFGRVMAAPEGEAES